MHRYLPAAAVSASLALIACAPAPAAPPALTVAGLWRVDQARTEPILDRSKARLDFGSDGVLTGNGSCNTLRASYTLTGSDIKIGPVTTTRMACGTLQMEQEDRILQALENAATAKVRSDGLLELRDADGRGVLRGTRFGVDD
jgi:heat shock protein HslJ